MTYHRSVFAFFVAIALAACSNANTVTPGDDDDDEIGGSASSGKGGGKGTGGRAASGGSSQDSTSSQQSEATGGHATGGHGQGGSTKAGGGGRGGGGTGGRSDTTTSKGDGGSHAGGKTGAGGGKAGAAGASGAVGSGGSAGASGGPGTGGSAGDAGTTPKGDHWVGTWTASPYYDSSKTDNPALANSILRQIAHVSLGGSQLRVQFSNLFGNGAVNIKSAHIALCKGGATADSTIDTATDKALAFSGTEATTIAQGKEIWSDPVDFNIPALTNLTITISLGSVASNLVGHVGSRTTSYVQAGGTDVSAASIASAKTIDRWYYISGIDVMADASAKGVAAIGDSITDGRGTDTNKNNRWTDILAAQLHANAATANVSVMNQGIGATNLVGSGTGAETRFARDVLGQSGIRYAIVYDGVNDINGGATFESMKAVYDKMITQAHAKNVLIYGATILPFGGNTGGYYSAAHEQVRQKVNTYIKSGAFDGYIDFDAALTDGGNPPKIADTYAKWAETDGLHPGPAGYKKMGESIDLTLFTK
jgi:lysophospholipase L1-like esterase